MPFSKLQILKRKWHLLGRQIRATLRDEVDTLVERVARHAQVRLAELVRLRPAERRVAETLLENGETE